MSERLVTNTGPMVALARADALFIVDQLDAEFICPSQVAAELEQGGGRRSRPGDARVLADRAIVIRTEQGRRRRA